MKASAVGSGGALAVLLALASCGGPPKAAQTEAGPVTETFDPRSLNEDMLLIQPQFEAPTAPPASAAPPPVPEVESAAPVFRVQIMALGDAERAQERAAALEELLRLPVQVEDERGLYLLRVGAYASAAEARQLRQRLVGLHPDYAGAYVVGDDGPVGARDAWADIGEPGEASAGTDRSQQRVPAFGWRILLNEFNRYEDAVKLKQEASRRLARDDIDITFDAPYYKVQVGHFRTEADAQNLFERIVFRRYPSALKVRGEIMLPAEER